MTLFKTSFLNGIAVIIRMLTNLVLNKILAAYLGPSGYAALGQFQNTIQMVTTFASGAITTGVTKFTSEFEAEQSEQVKFWRTGGSISIFGSLFASLVVVFLSKDLALLLIGDQNFQSIFLLFALSLPFLVFNSYLLAILNGKKEIMIYVLSNISGSFIALFATIILAKKFGLWGALLSLAVYQSLTFVATVFMCRKKAWFKLQYFVGKIDPAVAKKLFRYTAMALTSAVCVPLSHIFVRWYLTKSLDASSAGFWEGMWRLSSSYLMLITTTLSVYYLPRLAELKRTEEIRKEVFSVYKLLIPAITVGFIAIFLLREIITTFLFSPEFLPMKELFMWQLVGDFFRVVSWVLAFILTAKSYTRVYILSEILFSLLFCFLVLLLTHPFRLEGVVLAHAGSYLFYLIAMAYFFKREKLF